MKPKAHIVAHDGRGPRPFGFECLHCGSVHALQVPISLAMWGEAAKAFHVLHRDCKERRAGARRQADSFTINAVDGRDVQRMLLEQRETTRAVFAHGQKLRRQDLRKGDEG
ncbi:MAG: hypothetical protein JNK15_03215 [Planctomycetes bacterium]|nr:hypothetical protein [Planctomycetota bacterium]